MFIVLKIVLEILVLILKFFLDKNVFFVLVLIILFVLIDFKFLIVENGGIKQFFFLLINYFLVCDLLILILDI